MSESNKDEKKHLDNAVKSKIKGLGLEALFHQVDLSTKDKTPYTDQLASEQHSDKDNQSSADHSVRWINPFEESLQRFNTKVLDKFYKHLIHIFIDKNSVRLVIYHNEQGQWNLIDSLYVHVNQAIMENKDKFFQLAQTKIAEKLQKLNDPHPLITSFIERNKAIIKTISIPTHDQREIDRMISFEAEHQFAIPTHQLCYDYCVSAQTPKSTDIILAAVKKEEIDEHIAFLKELNLQTTTINLSALGLYNAPNTTPSDNYIQINISFDFIDINIIEQGSLKLTRGLHWGINDLTQKTSQTHNINLDVAFKMLNDNGIVLQENDDQSMEQKVSTLIKTWAKKLIDEVNTTLSEHQAPIENVYITGPGSSIKHLSNFIETKLKIRTAQFSSKMAAETNPQELSFLTQDLNHPDRLLSLNLASPETKSSQHKREKKVLQFAYAKIVLMILAILFVIPQGLLFAQKQYIKQLDGQLTQLSPQVKIIQEERKKLKSFEDYISPKQSSLEILRELSLIVSDDIIIQSYTFLKNDYVTLLGLGGSNSSVVSLTKAIRESDQFKQATLKYIKRIDRENADVNFEIVCKLN